ncbi:MAG: hypothetical protein C0467_10160 [Planctomycetaceae bacterium]|nr:hypothetical protein [Planctomycetaceae bacterium]
MKRFIGYPLGYVWASPNSVLGLGLLPFVLMSGGRARFQSGVVELYGGFAAWFLRNIAGGAGAMTLGHVIVARDLRMLNFTRNHEHVHVGQYMQWGPLFLPMYGLSSFLCWRAGLNPYLENRFEKVAYGLHPCFGEPPDEPGATA